MSATQIGAGSLESGGRKLLRLEVRNAETPIERKPEWIKTRAKMGPEYTALHSLVKSEELHTVCSSSDFTRLCSAVYSGPILARVLIHSGLRSIGVSALRTSRRSNFRPSCPTWVAVMPPPPRPDWG